MSTKAEQTLRKMRGTTWAMVTYADWNEVDVPCIAQFLLDDVDALLNADATPSAPQMRVMLMKYQAVCDWFSHTFHKQLQNEYQNVAK